MNCHPHARILAETRLGLTSARLKGMGSTSSELLVFVDDDNVLDRNYLSLALEIADSHPFLGTWGAGLLLPEFEEEPAPGLRRHTRMLCLQTECEKRWANLNHFNESVPIGAGMCVRRQVAEAYTQAIATDPFRLALDRKGTLLISGGDVDLALTACDIGLGTGVFPELRLTHLISRSRCQENYLVRLAHGMVYSSIMADSIRRKIPHVEERPVRRWLKFQVRQLFRFLSLSRIDSRIEMSRAKGIYDALAQLQQMSK